MYNDVRRLGYEYGLTGRLVIVRPYSSANMETFTYFVEKQKLEGAAPDDFVSVFQPSILRTFRKQSLKIVGEIEMSDFD